MIPWQAAWRHALYGPDGFYRRAPGPAGHFTTSTHPPLGAPFAAAVLELARREGARQLVDLGCGRGELLTQLRALDPALALLGVDLVPRPEGLEDSIGWLTASTGALLPEALVGLRHVLVVANEWLDVVPCPIASVDGRGTLRHLLVDAATGAEAPGEPLGSADADWVARHWAALSPGDRVEVGRSRDEAWAGVLSRVRSGTAVAIDYGHLADGRPRTGTLTGYRDGVQVPPVPDGGCDLTAHVAVDSLSHDERLTQREALRCLGVRAAPVDLALARADPAAYLLALSRQSAEAALLRAGALGDFWWVLKRLG